MTLARYNPRMEPQPITTGRAIRPSRAKILTLVSLALLLLAILFWIVRVLPFAVVTGLVIAAFVSAIAAGYAGRRQSDPFDGRLSLALAIVSGALAIYHALQAGLLIQTSLAS